MLQRRPGDEPAQWSLIHRSLPGRHVPSSDETYRVRIEASDEPLGSVWALRSRGAGPPDAVQTRLLAAVADQVGQALARDRAAEEMRAAEVARQSDALKTSLLQAVSHDFRTPLAVIRAAAGSIDEDERATPEDRRADRLAIEREVEYLNRLVANLLDMSRIEAGALRADRDVFELEELVERALVRVRTRAGGRTIEADIDPVVVRVDPVFLDAILANILDNALRYTADDGRIRIAARAHDGSVRLCVEDDGPGVADDARERIFEKFYRVPGAHAGSRGGLGVGLAVVRGLAEAMGGQVHAERASLGGLAIVLDLPAADVPAAEVPDAVAIMRPEPGGAEILVVEDDAATRVVIARALVHAGYRVVEAPDGRSGLERFAARRPDLVLLDLGLPDMDGLRLIHAFRREATTPILILSGRFEEREKVEALDRGADDYVTKPFGADELRARIRVALRHASGPAGGAGGMLVVGPIELDPGRHLVHVSGTRVELAPREFEILRVLLEHRGRIVTKGRLLRAVWGEAYQGEDDYVYVHVSRIRRKLTAADPAAAAGRLITTEPGVGYRVGGD